MSHHYSSYKNKLAEWERLYGKPPIESNFNPTQLQIACVGCGSTTGRMTRHHIASDFQFALFMPDVYAYRYMEFRKEDCAWLCWKRCHKNVEKYYTPIKRLMWNNYSLATLNEEWCEQWKQRFRDAFERWLATRKDDSYPKTQGRRHSDERPRHDRPSVRSRNRKRKNRSGNNKVHRRRRRP